MARLRILFVIDRAVASGGAERFAIGLAVHLPRDRFEPWVCATRDIDSSTIEVLDQAGIPFLKLGRRTHWDVHRLVKLAVLLRRERFDIVHTHKFGSNLWGGMIARACGVQAVVAQEHTWSYSGNPVRKWLDGHVIAGVADRFVAVSAADGARMVALERVPREKVVVLPTGYIPSHHEVPTDIRAELQLDRDDPVIAMAALLRRQKRIDVMLHAYAHIVHRVPNAHLVIAGDGPCRAELEQMAHALGVQEGVHFLGYRTDVDGILGSADVAAISSDWEGSPLFAFECMASGTPLVATAVGGLSEIVADGRTGVLVPRGNSGALADAIVGVLCDPQRRRSLAAAARQRLDDFTIEAGTTRFAALYASLVPDT